MRGSCLGEKACDNWIACGQALAGRAKRNPGHRNTRRRRSRRRPIAAGVAVACPGNRARRLGADGACALSNGHDAATVAQESAGHITRASHFRSLMFSRRLARGRRRRAVMAEPATKSIADDRLDVARAARHVPPDGRLMRVCRRRSRERVSSRWGAPSTFRTEGRRAVRQRAAAEPSAHERHPPGSARTLDRVMPGRTALCILQFGCPAPSALAGTSRKRTRSERGGAAWR